MFSFATLSLSHLLTRKRGREEERKMEERERGENTGKREGRNEGEINLGHLKF